MSPEQTQALLDTLDQFLQDGKMIARVRKVDFSVLHDKVSKVRTSVIASRNQALSINQKLGNIRFKKKPVKWTPEGKALWSQEADALFYKIQQAGFDDMAAHLEKTLGTKQPYAVYGQWAQARLDAALKGKSVGGATEVDNMIREFLENKDVWGGPVAARGVEINKAIDKIRDAYDTLGKINIPKDLSEIVARDASRLTEINKSINNLRGGYAILEREGLLTRGQVRGVEKTFIQANDAISKGTNAYMDTSVVNKARKQAATQHRKMNADAFKSPEQMRAEAAGKVGATVERITKFSKAAFGAVDGKLTTVARIGQAGVIGFNNLDEEDRHVMFEQAYSVLPALVGAPEVMEEAIGDYLGASYNDTPEATVMAGVSSTQSMFWLNSQLPRRDRSLYGKGLPPSKGKRDAFLEKLVAVIDPMSVPEAALLGRVTKGMIDALRVTSPSLYAQIGVVASQAIEQADPIKAPRQVINGLKQLLGGIDPCIQVQLYWNYRVTTPKPPHNNRLLEGPVVSHKHLIHRNLEMTSLLPSV